ncbi:Maltose permease [Fusarium falciforme]|uniref:Maltose permease n=1 Tax=Fusarium falciforme TaxID=195108 RepID=UPI002300E8FD|nr:Maltose permease [Fusarium falciforme]WAO94388.1 Maltose permease [Fusarium falciforme]
MSDSKDEITAVKPGAVHDEHVVIEQDSLTTWQCLKANPKIVMWTLWANIGPLMVGYENLAMSVCLAMPAFQMRFATPVNGTLIIPAYWQSLWSAMYNVTTMLGSMSAGFCQDRFGRRSVFLASILIAVAGISLVFTSNTPPEFLGGKIVSGYAMGLILAGTQTWVSEVAPLPMRGIALSTYAIMLNLGLLLAISVTFSRVSIMNDSAFRVVFAVAWCFPGLLALGLPFMPESPYWLTSKNRHEEARRALERLSPAGQEIEPQLVQIQHSIETERRLAAEKTSYLELFRGTNLRRSRILLICMYMPQVAGAVLSSNAPYFLSQTGMDNNLIVKILQVAVSLGVVSAVLNVVAMTKFSHRTLMFSGVGVCLAFYLAMGIAGTMARTSTTLTVIGVAVAFPSISYGPTVGASMAVAGEVSSIKLRSKSLAVGQAFSSIVSTVWTIVLPYMFNQDEADMGGNIGWIFFGMSAVYLVILYFDVPNTRGRSYEELDLMFEKKLPAKRFSSYKFDDEGEIAG